MSAAEPSAAPSARQLAEPSAEWRVGLATLFRALGYAVGLPAFMVGTALFMLGFSLARPGILHTATILYCIAFAGIGGRVAVAYYAPADRGGAVRLALGVALASVACYGLLRALLWFLAAD